MSYLDNLKEQADYTRTLNGALTHGSTGDACLDLFAMAGGMRYRNASDIIRMFELAYIENRELAMKLLFHIRDIREGMGERQMFRTLLRQVVSSGRNPPERMLPSSPSTAAGMIFCACIRPLPRSRWWK